VSETKGPAHERSAGSLASPGPRGHEPWELFFALTELSRTQHSPEVYWSRVVALIASSFGTHRVVLTTGEPGREVVTATYGVPVDVSIPSEMAPSLRAGAEHERNIREVDWPWESEPAVESAREVPIVEDRVSLGTLFLGWQESSPSSVMPSLLRALGAHLATLVRLQQLDACLEEKEQWLARILDHVSEALILYDPQGKVILYNNKAATIVGHRNWDSLGTSAHPFVVRDPQGRLLERSEWPLIKAMESKLPFLDEECILDFGHTQRYIRSRVTPVMDENGEVWAYLASGQDITDHWQADRQKTDFISVATHELRGPLTPLTGLLQLLRKQVEGRKVPELDLVRRAEDQTQRLRRLLDDLLDMSRIERGHLRVYLKTQDLRPLLTGIMDPWINGRQGHRFTLELPDYPVIVAADADRLEQVITNLVDNAVKHGRRDGKVTVALERRDDLVVVRVADEGDGIPEEVLKHMFDRFFHTHTSTHLHRSSMGLGLYICREIVEAHGGVIRIDSGSGEPTVVQVELPVA
jgi:PAS domain S-box-containing protein